MGKAIRLEFCQSSKMFVAKILYLLRLVIIKVNGSHTYVYDNQNLLPNKLDDSIVSKDLFSCMTLCLCKNLVSLRRF